MTDSTSLFGNWNYPTSIKFGAGRISELVQWCVALGFRNPLLVTDSGLASVPFIAHMITSNVKGGVPTAVFSSVNANPDGENIEQGVEVMRSGKHDGVIAVGGGSALDAGKAIALMAGQSRPIWDFEDIGDNWKRVNAEKIFSVIAVPTTAGTGSEVGRASIILNRKEKLKKIIFHPKMMPEIVIADPQLCIGLPAKLTAATGMDALSHNLEAYFAPGFHPLADGIALRAVDLIKSWLPVAVAEPENIAARAHMLAASSMGATAFQKGLGAMHALAHPIGALTGQHHGMLNAILMPYVMQANATAIQSKMQYLATCLGLKDEYGVMQWILELRASIGIPDNLKSLSIEILDFNRIGELAVKDPSASSNPILFDAKAYSRLCALAFSGSA